MNVVLDDLTPEVLRVFGAKARKMLSALVKEMDGRAIAGCDEWGSCWINIGNAIA